MKLACMIRTGAVSLVYPLAQFANTLNELKRTSRPSRLLMRLSCCVHKFYRADFESEPIARLRSNDVNRWAATALPRSVWRGRALRLSSLICSTNESPPRRDAEGLLDGESDGDTNILGVGRFDEKK